MKKRMMILMMATASCLVAGRAHALGGDSLTAYGTLWDGKEAGYGVGLKYKKSLIDILFFDVRGGYVEFDDRDDTTLIPLEASFNVGFPGPVTPYVGVGAGYYFIDHPVENDAEGYFGQFGIEFTIFKIGAMAEVRYLDLEGTYFDDFAGNIGILLKF